MQTITLVTGNPGKLVEWQRLFPTTITLKSADIDLAEIQSLDMDEIIADKARRAFEAVQSPVMVEDISAGLDNLGGLPGPFIKFFEVKLGLDALYKLANNEGDPATVMALAAYYDGTTLLIGRGVVHGGVCSSRGSNGFGFDKCFVPGGQPKSYGEMVPAEKDAISHRSLAIADLVPQIVSLHLGTKG